MIPKIYEADIDLVRELNTYKYVQTMKGVVTDSQMKQFKNLQDRLQALSDFYKQKYDNTAGVFRSERSTGNPISYHGNLRRVWSGIYKGTDNKQYAAQISFVINFEEEGLDIGFYFGRAGSFNMKKDIREKLFLETKELGKLLYTQICSDELLQTVYHSLFDLGFKAEIREERVTAEDWLQNLIIDPNHSSVVFTLKPNENGEIDSSGIDLYVAMVIPLISGLPEYISKYSSVDNRKNLRPLSPEQRAKQAEQRALIGLTGEKHVMHLERERLKGLGLQTKYPIHRALISDNYGYDILSIDEAGNEIFIEVKTTTLLKQEQRASVFFISFQEFSFYEANARNYRLYRVYDIYGEPNLEILDLAKLNKSVDKYKIEY